MLEYKRNQEEEAISRVLHPDAAKPSAVVRTKMKRLLDLDRSRGRNPRSTDPELANFAFFSEDAPGKGVEISFSPYEVFALLVALQLLEHGWPQGFALAVMRRIRRRLEHQHAQILAQDPAALDRLVAAKNARTADLTINDAELCFLVIASSNHNPRTAAAADHQFEICWGAEAVDKFVKKQGAWSWSVFELAGLAHQLSQQLKKTQPRKRGRSG
jgi:hypothetical protein